MRHRQERRGFVVFVALGGLLLFTTYAIYASSLVVVSQSEFTMTGKRFQRERARLIAESAIEMGRALTFQNPFTNRWYRQQPVSDTRYGWCGTMSGDLCGGTFRLIGEDVTNSTKHFSAGSLSSIKDLTYNRVDLFAEGRFGNEKVIVYQGLYWHPEEQVFTWDATPTTSVDPSTGTTIVRCDNFRQR